MPAHRPDSLSFPISADEITFEDWQNAASDAWVERGRRGIIIAPTGVGKSLAGVRAMCLATAPSPELRIAVVVPTKALAAQWKTLLISATNLREDQIGMVGGGQRAKFRRYKVIIFVLASARKMKRARSRLARVSAGHRVMLVVDECHRAGARKSQRIFDLKAACRLGLSATARRDDADSMDATGGTLPLEKQPHGKALGGVCYRMTLADARRMGMLPRYEIHHHAVALNAEEWTGYERKCREITDLRKLIRSRGGDPDRYRRYLSVHNKRVSKLLREAAVALQNAYFSRKRFLYQAAERIRVTRLLLANAWSSAALPHGALLFNELIDPHGADGAPTGGAEELVRVLREDADAGRLPFTRDEVALEHSGLPDHERRRVVEGLRDGDVEVLVTVKALREGIDVPAVGMGVSVASSSSIIGIIQTMGRLLRPARDERGRRIARELAPIKQIHILHVGGTVDERRYRDVNWDDLMGAEHNRWWRWDLGASAPVPAEPLMPGVSAPEAETAPDDDQSVHTDRPSPAPIRLPKRRSGKRRTRPLPSVQRPTRRPVVSQRQPMVRANVCQGPWFRVFMMGVEAYKRRDRSLADAALSQLSGSHGRGRHGCRALRALLAGERLKSKRSRLPSTYPELLLFMARAYNSGRHDMVDAAVAELNRRARNRPNARRIGLARAASALARPDIRLTA